MPVSEFFFLCSTSVIPMLATIASDTGGSSILLELLREKLSEITTVLSEERNLTLEISGIQRFGKLKYVSHNCYNAHTNTIVNSYHSFSFLSFTFTLLDGCPPESTIVPFPNRTDLDITLMWPESNLGETPEISCPCSNLSLVDGQSHTASRRCGGNFLVGASWEDPEDSACNFTEIARQLCRILEVRP